MPPDRPDRALAVGSGPRGVRTAHAADPRILPFSLGLLDRYLLRLVAPGFCVGIGVFVFALLLNELVRNIQLLVTQGASPRTVGLTLAHLLPGLLAVAVPSALLLGILLALNRLSNAQELIALRAGGASPWRLFVPVAIASALGFGLSATLLLEVVPQSNRRFVELSAELLNSRLRSEIRPRIFYDELLDGRVLLVGEAEPDRDGWRRIFLADTAGRADPTIFLADRGRIVAAPEERIAFLELEQVEVHNARLRDPGRYRIQRAAQLRLPLDPNDVFGPETASPRRHARAMRLPELRDAWEETGHPVYRVEIHKKFALPFACVAFGLLGLGLGIRPSPGPAGAGAFAVAVLVVFAYYVPLASGEQLAISGEISPWLAMWGANILTVAAGAILLVLASKQLDPLAAVSGAASRAGRSLLGAARFGRPAERRSRLPGLPTVLDRYLTSRLVRFLLIALAALVTVMLIGRLIAVIGDAFEHEAPGLSVARYLALSLPQFAAQMLPLATLTGTLVTFAVLARRHEVVAFQSGGVSRARLALPALAVGFAASLGGLWIQEVALPVTDPQTDEIRDRIEGRPRRTLDPLQRHWILGDAGQIVHYEEFDGENAVLSGVSVFSPGADGTSLRSRWYASSAHWSESERAWVAIGGWRRQFAAETAAEPFALRVLPLAPPPDALLREDRVADQLPFRELRERIARVEAAGHRAAALRVDLHRKAAGPFASLVTVLIALPFAFRQTNRSGRASAAIALGIGTIYLVAVRFFGFLGDAGLLGPLLAAWSPNLFFSLASVSLLFQNRT